MRKFTVTTSISRHATAHQIRRPSKDIQLGDLIEFKFSNDNAKAVVRQWDGQKTCNECVLFGLGNKPTRCIHFNNRNGKPILLCNSVKGSSFVFSSVDDLMEEI